MRSFSVLSLAFAALLLQACVASVTQGTDGKLSVGVYQTSAHAHAKKGDFAAAINDLDQAIQLQPEGGALYNDRGWAHMMQGEMAAALSDLSRAIELTPEIALPYENRATYYFIQGDYRSAIADIERSQKINPENPFSYIWLYIAVGRDHRDPAQALQKAANATSDWPGVILHFIQGKATELNVHEEVRSGPYGAVSDERDCQSQLLLGELDILNQWAGTAASRFRYASSACPLGQTERIIADAELKRL